MEFYELDREEQNTVRTIVNSYIEDDGWNPPKEIYEEVEIRLVQQKNDEYKRMKQQYEMHKGKWLTYDVVNEYDAKSWIFRVLNDYQYIKQVRSYGEQLRKEYGLTQLEAINIVLGHSWLYEGYVSKYENIKNYKEQPMQRVNERSIRESYLDVKHYFEEQEQVG